MRKTEELIARSPRGKGEDVLLGEINKVEAEKVAVVVISLISKVTGCIASGFAFCSSIFSMVEFPPAA